MYRDLFHFVSICNRFCFCQEPQSKDAYDAKLISVHNFCIEYLDLKHKDVYSWDEIISDRGSTEITSALSYYLSCINFENHVEIINNQ